MKKIFKKPLFWIVTILLIGILVFVGVGHFRTANQNEIEPYFEGKGLCVKIVDYDGANYTEEPRYNYHEIQKFDGVTAPGVNTTIFSITDVEKEYIVVSFKEPLLQDGNKVSEIKLSIGDSVELKTSAEGAGTAYTFSIEDWPTE